MIRPVGPNKNAYLLHIEGAPGPYNVATNKQLSRAQRALCLIIIKQQRLINQSCLMWYYLLVIQANFVCLIYINKEIFNQAFCLIDISWLNISSKKYFKQISQPPWLISLICLKANQILSNIKEKKRLLAIFLCLNIKQAFACFLYFYVNLCWAVRPNK